jgi:hypothetical protein
LAHAEKSGLTGLAPFLEETASMSGFFKKWGQTRQTTFSEMPCARAFVLL